MELRSHKFANLKQVLNDKESLIRQKSRVKMVEGE